MHNNCDDEALRITKVDKKYGMFFDIRGIALYGGIKGTKWYITCYDLSQNHSLQSSINELDDYSSGRVFFCCRAYE